MHTLYLLCAHEQHVSQYSETCAALEAFEVFMDHPGAEMIALYDANGRFVNGWCKWAETAPTPSE